MTARRLAWRWCLLRLPFALGGLVALVLPPLLSACGSTSSTSPGPVGALAKAAPFTQGEPALVFVYTDG